MKVNGLIQVRWYSNLLTSGLETQCKVVERHESIRMTRGTECKCSLLQVNGLIQVRQDTPLLKSDMETASKIME
jgi:hypothetical protein